MRIRTLLALLTAALILAGCGPAAAPITVTDPWARAAVVTGMSAQGEAHGAAPMAQGADATPMAGGMGAEMAARGGTSAVYMTLTNSGATADRLVAASSDVADVVELHEARMVDNVMQMEPVAGGIEVPANGVVALKPGGLHVMLIGLRRDLKAGERISLTLTFERAGAMVVEAPVRAP